MRTHTGRPSGVYPMYRLGQRRKGHANSSLWRPHRLLITASRVQQMSENPGIHSTENSPPRSSHARGRRPVRQTERDAVRGGQNPKCGMPTAEERMAASVTRPCRRRGPGMRVSPEQGRGDSGATQRSVIRDPAFARNVIPAARRGAAPGRHYKQGGKGQ